jgi:NitT/TauT family transport system substrate-binding protein
MLALEFSGAEMSLLPSPRVLRSALRFVFCGWVVCATAAPAQAQEKFTFYTDWYAQAEHGGFYQAQATGLYKKAGLDVTLKMGGPQLNIMQIMAAGQADCVIGYDMQMLSAWAQGVRTVSVAASFQKDASVLIGHPGVVNKMEDIQGKTLLIGAAANSTFWPWLKAKYKVQDANKRPYNFNIQPFIADKNLVQQGLLSSEPHAIEKEAKFKPNVFLLADYGWPPYSTTILCMEKTVKERPQAVAAFVKASMEGWKSYLKGDASAANALIKRDNPAMTDDAIAVAIKLLNSQGIVMGGDAAKLGVGIITDERMKATYDFMVAEKLLDGSKVELKKTYTTQFVKDLKILP